MNKAWDKMQAHNKLATSLRLMPTSTRLGWAQESLNQPLLPSLLPNSLLQPGKAGPVSNRHRPPYFLG